MCIEFAIAFVILLAIVIAAIYLGVKVGDLEDENERLRDGIDFRSSVIDALIEELEESDRVLAKKDSLISILRNEIEEKENV